MAGAGISGLAVFYATAGGVLLWSGFKGQTIAQTVKAITSGNSAALAAEGSQTVGSPTVTDSPATAAGETDSAGAVAAVGGTVSTATEAANQAMAVAAAAVYGWIGPQWTALNNIEMGEAGWNNLAQNPSSGAFGIAQALGHGTAGTAGKYGNNYGANYTLTTSQAIAANNGSAGPQIQWMLAYIKAAYGTPEAAWAFHQANGYY
jgi:resuscitation-promoting factor RpfB